MIWAVVVTTAPAVAYAALVGFLMTWRKDPGDGK